MKEQPSSEGLVADKQTEIFENWEELTQRADNRKTNLEQSRELQKFLADLRDLVSIRRYLMVRSSRLSKLQLCQFGM